MPRGGTSAGSWASDVQVQAVNTATTAVVAEDVSPGMFTAVYVVFRVTKYCYHYTWCTMLSGNLMTMLNLM